MTLGTRRLDRGAKLLKGALVDLNAEGIVSSAGAVTRWNNSGSGGSAYDLATVIGTAANLTPSTLNGVPCVHAAGGVGIETLAGGVTINQPMTMFLVAKIDAVGGASASRFVDAESDTSISVGIFEQNSLFYANAGANQSVGPSDTDPHLHTIRHNGDASSSYTVSGIGAITGNIGAENLDAMTLFASTTGGATLTGSIGRHIIFDYELSDADVNLIQERLSIEHGV
jgi:hypothetical protein